jgi:hypothetical protein
LLLKFVITGKTDFITDIGALADADGIAIKIP